MLISTNIVDHGMNNQQFHSILKEVVLKQLLNIHGTLIKKALELIIHALDMEN
jgi:hypothetical protein